MDELLIKRLRRRLLAWYRRHRRDLPWRAAPGDRADPYHVFVSEAMLQQTQVATVIRYFNRFIAAFPTVESLAAADEQAVLRMWQGLGYYRRARNLHAAAKAIVKDHGGRVPRDVESLLTLPGVGRYTAGAVASIAHGVRAPILDGNVARVLARWFAIEDPVDAPATRERLWEIAARLVPEKSAGDFNQGLMELGALVCTPRAAGCLVCPVAKECEAAKRSMVDRLPVKIGKKAPKPVTHHIVAIERDGAFLFEQRPDKGLWSRMWQLPTAEELEPGASPRAIGEWILSRTGLRITDPAIRETFTHQTTHRTITFVVWVANVQGWQRRGAGTWRRVDAIDDLPLANPQRKAVGRLSDPNREA